MEYLRLGISHRAALGNGIFQLSQKHAISQSLHCSILFRVYRYDKEKLWAANPFRPYTDCDHGRTFSVREIENMPPKDKARKGDYVQPADEIVQNWWEDPARIKAWEELKTKIDEAIDTMDTKYLELSDIHDLMLIRAARYAQDFLENGVFMREAVVNELQRKGKDVEVESYDDLINGRGENPVKYSQAKALVIEMVQKTIMVKQEVRRLRQGISEDSWKTIMKQSHERR